MIRTTVTRTLPLAGFTPAGRLSHSSVGLLPLMALCLATAVWSQTPPGPRGPSIPREVLTGVHPATAGADTPEAANYRFITIVNPAAPTGALPYGINDAGLVTGQYADQHSHYHGFGWLPGVFLSLDYPGSVGTYLGGVNNLGVAAVGYSLDGTTFHSAAYSFPSGAWTTYPDIPGYSSTEWYYVSDPGVGVGEAFGASTAVAWIWDPVSQSYSFMAVPGSAQYSTAANGINDKGQVVGQFTDAEGVQHGFLKDRDTYTTLDPPGSTNTIALAINNSGVIAGYWINATGGTNGFVRASDGQYTTVNYPGAGGTTIYGINNRGDICGQWYSPRTGNYWAAFVGYRR